MERGASCIPALRPDLRPGSFIVRSDGPVRLEAGAVGQPEGTQRVYDQTCSRLCRRACGRSPGLPASASADYPSPANMVLDIWKGEAPYDLKGRFFEVTTANTMIPEIGQGSIIKPYQQPHPPIVVTAVAPHSKGVTEAAKRGWHPISANFLLPEWVASHWPRYTDFCPLT